MTKEEKLFQSGVDAFNRRNFYDAHEFWEELWLDYQLKDAKFIQGLIQLAVGYFHFFNQNLNGARSMVKKCLAKFDGFEKQRGLDVNGLVLEIKLLQDHFNKINNTIENIDSYIITLKVIHE